MARASSKPGRPQDARVHTLTVQRREQVSSSFVRVTLAGDADFDRSFRPVGHDQWFRLFLPNGRGALGVPGGTGDGWYRRWLLIPPARRAVFRNYTIRQARRRANSSWELDVDLVAHAGPSGQVDGVAASWALTAEPGDAVGFLDQGMLFAPSDAAAAAADGGRAWLVADETGLPGVEGVLSSLGTEVPVTCVLEVPHDDDRRPLADRPGLDVRWLVRDRAGALPGQAALAELLRHDLGAADYVYTVGEGSMTLDVRKAARKAGLRKERIEFCAYWRPARRAA